VPGRVCAIQSPEPLQHGAHQFRTEQAIEIRPGKRPHQLKNARARDQCPAQVVVDRLPDEMVDQYAGEQLRLVAGQAVDRGQLDDAGFTKGEMASVF